MSRATSAVQMTSGLFLGTIGHAGLTSCWTNPNGSDVPETIAVALVVTAIGSLLISMGLAGFARRD